MTMRKLLMSSWPPASYQGKQSALLSWSHVLTDILERISVFENSTPLKTTSINIRLQGFQALFKMTSTSCLD